jgi:hypothetical protein
MQNAVRPPERSLFTPILGFLARAHSKLQCYIVVVEPGMDKRNMREILIGGLIVVGLYASSEPANARGNGAWCARTNTGAGRVEENCGFSSIEACRRWVTGGNRGFCSRNPAYKKRQSFDR